MVSFFWLWGLLRDRPDSVLSELASKAENGPFSGGMGAGPLFFGHALVLPYFGPFFTLVVGLSLVLSWLSLVLAAWLWFLL